MSWAIFGLVLFLPCGVRGTLTPNGTVALDCGSQQEFTCDVSDITTGNPGAGWRINGLFNITAPGVNGLRVANDNIRITGMGGNVPTSTITIANFDMRDDGGTVQCVNTEDNSGQGTATISVAIPSCTSITANNDLNDECTSATVNWQHSLSNTPLVTSVTVTYCPTSSPNCGNSMKCTASPCTITGLTPIEDHYLTVIPNNNCGSPTGCTGNIPTRELPSCPTNFSANRDGDFTSATVTYQLATPPPVTSTTVTYCYSNTSSTNCEDSMNCTTSPCTISGLDPCEEYNVSATPTNNCGNTTECTGNSMVLASQGVPSCAEITYLQNGTDEICSVNLMWRQPTTTPPVTSTTVTYCTSSSDCGKKMDCPTTGPCTISGLEPDMEYNFTVILTNNCGDATGCTGNSDTTTTPSNCTSMATTDPTTTTLRGVSRLVLLVLLVLLLIPLLSYPIGVLIVQRCCYEDKSYCEVFWCCWCCGCCAKGKSGRNSTEPMKSPTGDDDVQDKTEQKEEKLTYAALEFSEQAGSTGEKKIRSQEEPVQYAAVDQA